MASIPNCPLCGKPLRRVRNTGGWMNEDQFDAVKAGDWFCDCSSNDRGNAPYAYFWDKEVVPTEALPIPSTDTPAQEGK